VRSRLARCPVEAGKLGVTGVSDYGWDWQGYALVFAQLGDQLFTVVSQAQAFQEQVNKNED